MAKRISTQGERGVQILNLTSSMIFKRSHDQHSDSQVIFIFHYFYFWELSDEILKRL